MSFLNIVYPGEARNSNQCDLIHQNRTRSSISRGFKASCLSIPKTREANIKQKNIYFRKYHAEQEKHLRPHKKGLGTQITSLNGFQMITNRSYNTSKNFQMFNKFPTSKPKLGPNPFTPFKILTKTAPFLQRKTLNNKMRSNKTGYSIEQKLLPHKYDSFIFPEDLSSIGILQPTTIHIPHKINISIHNVKNEGAKSIQRSKPPMTQNYITADNLKGLFEFIHKKERYGFISSDQLKKQVFFHLDDFVGYDLTTALWAMENKTIILFDCLEYISKKRRRTKAVNIRIIQS